MAIFTTQISINKPAKEVWQLMRDETLLKKWLTNYVSGEHLSGEPGQAGSKSKMIFNERGRTMEIIEHILEVVENKKVKFILSHPTMVSEVQMRLIEKGNETVIIQTTNTKPQGFFMKLMFALMKSAMKKRTEADFQKLKQLAEG